MAAVSLEHLSVSLDGHPVLDDVDAEIGHGQFVAVIGPSGTGKSTLLRAIAGLASLSEGRVLFDGVDVGSLRPAERDVGFVFQGPTLLPTRNVRRNVQFPLEVRRHAAESIRERVGAEARALHIEHLLERNPAQLSRGEQQLVQIARTLVGVPRVLLLDEPFAPLDAALRQRMRREVQMLQAGYGVTTLIATNDPVDAMTLATRVMVLDGSPASVVQVGNPHDVYDEPASLVVAQATGLLSRVVVEVIAGDGGFWLTAPGVVRLRSWAPALASHVGGSVILGLRRGGLVRDDRGEAEARLVRIVPGISGGLLCRWGEQLVMADGVATPADIDRVVALRVERPQYFDPRTGDRIA